MSKSQRPEQAPLSRRTLFAGAGTLGAVAAAAALIPRVPMEAPAAPVARPVPTHGGGYSLTDHVQHYYKTARV